MAFLFFFRVRVRGSTSAVWMKNGSFFDLRHVNLVHDIHEFALMGRVADYLKAPSADEAEVEQR